MELYQPTIVLPGTKSQLVDTYVQLARQHIARLTGLELQVSDLLPESGEAIILVQKGSPGRLNPSLIDEINQGDSPGAEGYQLIITGDETRPVIVVAGADDRGVLYGVGRLLRNLLLEPGKIEIKPGFKGGSYTPALSIRGTHLSYTDQSTTYDAWTNQQFEQYLSELAWFGVNTLSLNAPWLGRRPFSPLYKEEPADMLLKAAGAANRLGLGVWLDLAGLHTVQDGAVEALGAQEWAELERLLPQLSGLVGLVVRADTVDGAERLAGLLGRLQPGGGIWLAFSPEESGEDPLLTQLLGLSAQPAWLAGVIVTGNESPEQLIWLQTQCQDQSLPVILYADITHSGESIFPVADGDPLLARFYGRAGIQPRPQAMAHAHSSYLPAIQGSVTYSEGVHDDLNKFVWADQDWQPGREVCDTVEEYSTVLISTAYRKPLTEGWISLEQNWHGQLNDNTSIDDTYLLWSDLHRLALEEGELRDNYRYQLGRIRALGDYYVKRKALYELELEQRAWTILADYPRLGADEALRRSREQLNLYRNEPVLPELANELLDLAESLFWACGLQLTTSGQNGQSWQSGAYLNVVREPLNHYRWLAQEYLRVLQLQEEADKHTAVEALLAYVSVDTNPEVLYYRLGSQRGFALVANPVDWQADPAGRSGAFPSANYKLLDQALAKQGWYDAASVPPGWTSSAATRCGTPLHVMIPGLSPSASYTLQVAYPYTKGEQPDTALFTAEDTLLEVLEQESTPVQRQAADSLSTSKDFPYAAYDLPQEAYADGTLRLCWQPLHPSGTVAVSEVRIVRKGGRSHE